MKKISSRLMEICQREKKQAWLYNRVGYYRVGASDIHNIHLNYVLTT